MGTATVEHAFLVGGKVFWAETAVRAAEMWGEESGDWNNELDSGNYGELVAVTPLAKEVMVRLVYAKKITAIGKLK